MWGMYLRINLSKRIYGKRRGLKHKFPLLNGKCGLANPTTLSMGLNPKNLSAPIHETITLKTVVEWSRLC